MRVLVIGGTKFIGLHAVKRLHELGHEVTVFHRGLSHVDVPEGVRHIYGDREDLPHFVEKFKRLAPDVIVHMILATEEEARTAVQTFTAISGRMVAISSQDVYRAYGIVNRTEGGDLQTLPLTEQSEMRRNLYPYRGKMDNGNAYQYDKILVEGTVLSEPKLPCTVLRLPAVYGPYDFQHRLFEYVKRMEDNRPYILLEEGLADWKWSRGYVENVAEAIVLAVTEPQATGRVYNVAEPHTFSTEEFVREIGHVVGWRGEVLRVPRELMPEVARTEIRFDQHIIVDSSRIRAELGYQERVSLREGLKRTIAWERHNPPAHLPPEGFDYSVEDELVAKIKAGKK